MKIFKKCLLMGMICTMSVSSLYATDEKISLDNMLNNSLNTFNSSTQNTNSSTQNTNVTTKKTEIQKQPTTINKNVDNKPSTQTNKPSTQTNKPSTQTNKPSTQTNKPSTNSNVTTTKTNPINSNKTSEDESFINKSSNNLSLEEFMKKQAQEQSKIDKELEKVENGDFVIQDIKNDITLNSSNKVTSTVSISKDNSPLTGTTVGALSKEEVEKKLTNDKTIQYTLNKKEQYPIYHETSYKVNEVGDISYEDAQDVLKLLSVKLDGNYIEDTDKTMIIIKGQPIVIKKTKNGFVNFEEIFKYFEDENIDITISPSRIKGQYNMTETLEFAKNIKVKINDTDITLGLDPIVKDSNVLFALRPIASGMGEEIEWNKKTGIAIVYDKDKNLKFKYSIHSNIVTINKETYELPIKPELNLEQLRILTTINLLVDETGAKSEFDTMTNTLHIYTHDYVHYDF